MAAFECRRIDQIAPYNEFMVAVPVLYRDAPRLPGAYVFLLPVTTDEARLGGVELYGFPKFLAEIVFEETDQVCRCHVRAEGRHVVTLQVDKANTKAIEIPDTYPYTIKNGELLRTRTQWRLVAAIADVRGGGCFALGDHPLAEQIRDLAMDSVSARHVYATQGQAMLHLPGERLPL